MKLAQFKTKTSDEARLGKLDNGVIVDITEVAATMLDFINKGSAAVQASNSVTPKTAYALDAVEYLPAVNAGKVIAIGRNYYDHAIEGGDEPPKSPLIFTKFTNSITAHNAPTSLILELSCDCSEMRAFVPSLMVILCAALVSAVLVSGAVCARAVPFKLSNKTANSAHKN